MAEISDSLADVMLNAYAATFGEGATLELREGETVVASLKLPPGAWKGAEGRALDVKSAWQGTAATGGQVDNYRLISATGHEDRGTVSKPSGSGDMRIDNPNLAPGQAVSINSFRKEF
jgi:hypothetical protein